MQAIEELVKKLRSLDAFIILRGIESIEYADYYHVDISSFRRWLKAYYIVTKECPPSYRFVRLTGAQFNLQSLFHKPLRLYNEYLQEFNPDSELHLEFVRQCLKPSRKIIRKAPKYYRIFTYLCKVDVDEESVLNRCHRALVDMIPKGEPTRFFVEPSSVPDQIVDASDLFKNCARIKHTPEEKELVEKFYSEYRSGRTMVTETQYYYIKRYLNDLSCMKTNGYFAEKYEDYKLVPFANSVVALDYVLESHSPPFPRKVDCPLSCERKNYGARLEYRYSETSPNVSIYCVCNCGDKSHEFVVTKYDVYFNGKYYIYDKFLIINRVRTITEFHSGDLHYDMHTTTEYCELLPRIFKYRSESNRVLLMSLHHFRDVFTAAGLSTKRKFPAEKYQKIKNDYSDYFAAGKVSFKKFMYVINCSYANDNAGNSLEIGKPVPEEW
jgi:hypothetical protein